MSNLVRGSLVVGLAACVGVVLFFQARQPRVALVQSSASPAPQNHPSAPPVPQNQSSAPAVPQVRPVPPIPPKSSRTPAQRKLDSHLLVAAQMARGTPKEPSLTNATQMLEMDENGNVHVDIDAKVTNELLARIAALCGTVESSFPNYGTIRAWIPLLSVETLASRPDVTFIKPADRAILNSQGTAGAAVTGRSSISDQPKGQPNVRTQSADAGRAKSQPGCPNQP